MTGDRSLPACALTGATGYVGGRLRRSLESAGWRVIPWTRRRDTSGVAVPFQLGQDVDPASFGNVQALVHCAYDFAPRRWDDIFAINVTGSRKLFDAARQAGVGSLIMISSSSAFPGCRSLYGRAKLEIEKAALAAGAVVVKPGLIYGDRPEGMFGRIVRQVLHSRFVPVLAGRAQTLYLIHDEDLGTLVAAALAGRVPPGTGPILAAHERGVPLAEVLRQISEAAGRRVTFVPVPWQVAWLGLKTLETLGVPTSFRSDSVAYEDPPPSFDLLKSLGFQCRPFRLTPAMVGAEVAAPVTDRR